MERLTRLILTRRAGEVLNIGDDIEIQVLQVSGKQVRIGITAPRNVAVHRNEIYREIQEHREIAAAPETAGR